MAKLTATEFMDKVKQFIGDKDDDETLSFLEDCKDTISGDTGNTDSEWKSKYEEAVKANEQLEKDWRKRYRDAFFSPASHTDDSKDENINPANKAHENDDEKPDAEDEAKKVRFDDLFTPVNK